MSGQVQLRPDFFHATLGLQALVYLTLITLHFHHSQYYCNQAQVGENRIFPPSVCGSCSSPLRPKCKTKNSRNFRPWRQNSSRRHHRSSVASPHGKAQGGEVQGGADPSKSFGVFPALLCRKGCGSLRGVSPHLLSYRCTSNADGSVVLRMSVAYGVGGTCCGRG